MIAWSYMTVETDDPLDDERLCQYGALGWILCAEMKTFVGRGYLARFRRPVEDDHKFDLTGVPLPDSAAGERREIGHCKGSS